MVRIGDAELDVLKVLWDHGPNTVRDINSVLESQGRTWAYTTVLTMLQRLREKGVVVAEKVGNVNRFSAALSREHIVHQELSRVMDRLCEGGAAPLMLSFVENQQFTPEEIEAFRALLDRVDNGPQE
jgi:BlaI family penicillinase repressor